jgi:plasmid stabilization system protein ParE
MTAIDFDPEAAAEALAAQDWYFGIDPKLGKDFRNELDRVLNLAATAPDRWGRHDFGTRCFPLRRFPYLLVYRHGEERIEVIAVQHAKRRPGYWRPRVEP